MKSNFSLGLFLFISIFSLCLSFPSLNAYQELPFDNPNLLISMDFQNANLKDILKIFSIQSGLNFIASEQVRDRTFTLYFDKVPIKEAMDKIFRANNLAYELDPESNIFIVKDLGAPEAELATKVFYLKYASVSSSRIMTEAASNLGSGGSTTGTTTGIGTSILTAVKKLLSKDGSVTEDSRTNSLIVQDISSRMPLITQAVAAMDVAVPQVMLEVEMLDVSKNTVDKIGFKFGQTPMTMVLTGAKRGTLWPFRDTSLPMASVSQMTAGTIDFSTATYTALLDFLKTQSDTKYLARPRILTLNNGTAEIKIATQEMIGTLTVTTTAEGTATTSAQAERVDTGVTLRVTPQVNTESGEITMFVMPTVKDTSTSTLNTSYKDPEERSTMSMVRIKDGETVIIGGLIRNDSSQTITKLPILGDIPVLGALFRHKNRDKDRERELLVFITPHIVKDNGIDLAQAKPANKVNFPEREQGAFSVLDRQAVIKTSLNSFEKR